MSRKVLLAVVRCAHSRHRRRAGRRALLQGQAAYAAHQLRARRPDRHRRPAARQAHRQSTSTGIPRSSSRTRMAPPAWSAPAYLGEVGPKDGSMFGYFTGTSWNYRHRPGEIPRRLPRLRVRRLSARQRRLLHPQRYSARDEKAGRSHEGAGPDHGRPRPRFVQGSAATPDLRHARAEIPLRHRLPFTATRRGSPCRTARSTCIRNRRRAILGVVEPNLVKTGKVVPIWYDPNYDGKSFTPAQMMLPTRAS